MENEPLELGAGSGMWDVGCEGALDTHHVRRVQMLGFERMYPTVDGIRLVLLDHHITPYFPVLIDDRRARVVRGRFEREHPQASL